MGVAGMPAGGFASFDAAFASGASVGFTTGFISSGGDLAMAVKGGLLGGASAGVTWGIGHGFGSDWNIGGKALAHGVTQGGFSELRGGSFREGFIGGSVGKLGGSVVHANLSESMQPVGMIAVAGIAGLATGGNSDTYLSAAVSAVMVYLYNDMGGKVKSNIAKGEVEAEFGEYLKGKLSSGGVELSVDLGGASITFDNTGKVSGSFGFIKGELAGIDGELSNLGVDVKGLNLTLSDFSVDTIRWKLHYSNSFFGYDLGQHFSSYGGIINVNPTYYLNKTNVGHRYGQYRMGSTRYVDNCMANNFEGC